MTEIKEAIEAAASSQDPAVRGMAIRYKTMERELADMEPFFSFYAKAQGEAAQVKAAAAPAAAAKKPAKPQPKRPAAPASSDMQAFVDQVKQIIAANEHPLSPGEVFLVMQRNGTANGLSQDTVRKRLWDAKNRGLLVSHDGGYWPADVALPQPAEMADAA